MRSSTEAKEKQAPPVRINPALNKYTSVMLFPEKMEKMSESIEKFGLPGFDKLKNLNSSAR